MTPPDSLDDAMDALILTLRFIREASDPVEKVMCTSKALEAMLDVSLALSYMRGQALLAMERDGLSDEAIASKVRLTMGRVRQLLAHHAITWPDVVSEQ